MSEPAIAVPQKLLAGLVLTAMAMDEALTQQGMAAAPDAYRTWLRLLIERTTALLPPNWNES